MKGYYRHILLASAVIMAAAACTKHTEYDTPETDDMIRLSATESGTTKALLNNGSFSANGNRIKVYDFVTNGETTEKHIESYAGPDVVSTSPLYVKDTTWPFTDEIDGTEADVKLWTPGTHKFFGWLAKDANMTASNTPATFFDGFSFNEGTHVLSISAKQMDPTVPQFDFGYSNIYTTEPTNNYVPLEFKHLFCAISFGIKNSGSSTVTINNVKVEKLYTKKSATITFPTASSDGSTDATVVYTDDTPNTYLDYSPNLTLDSGAHSNLIYNDRWTHTAASTSDDSSTRQYYLMWPQDVEDVYSKDEIVMTEVNVGTPWHPVYETRYEYPDSWLMSLTYNDGTENTIRLNFPNMAWEAGKKYHFDIHFAEKVSLYFTVVDWDTVKNEIEFE